MSNLPDLYKVRSGPGVSVFRFQDFATCLPYTRDLYKLSTCLLPFRGTFSERRVGKSLVPNYSTPIMFAHDLCHSRIEYFSLRLADPAAQRGMLSIKIEKTERSLRLVGVEAPKPRRAIQQIFNLHLSLLRHAYISFLNKSSTSLTSLGRFVDLVGTVPSLKHSKMTSFDSGTGSSPVSASIFANTIPSGA